ncbi:MAG: GTPase ObgE [Verrucomicrobiia bacterium]
MFVDRVRVWAKAGRGGNGSASFRREKFIPLGGPDGGDGGHGGHVIVRVNAQLNNLQALKFKPHLFAGHGANGMGAQKHGKRGKDLIVEVPPGTAIFHLATADEEFERAADESTAELVHDLTEAGAEIILCKGGRGGWGNVHFKSPTNQAPTTAVEGKEGEKGQFLFELKSIADIGLVGFPNAGKSSLLGALSAAKPKVASYPFTTLEPVIGTIQFDDFSRLTMADVPGLIEGAHAGVGLGHDFLRHIERCRALAFVIDMAGSEGRNPLEDYRQLRKEINLYDATLSDRAHFVVANKMDLPEAETYLAAFRRRVKCPIFPVSIAKAEGLEALKVHLRESA